MAEILGEELPVAKAYVLYITISRLPVCPYSYQKGRLTSALTVCPYIAIYKTDTFFPQAQVLEKHVRQRNRGDQKRAATSHAADERRNRARQGRTHGRGTQVSIIERGKSSITKLPNMLD